MQGKGQGSEACKAEIPNPNKKIILAVHRKCTISKQIREWGGSPGPSSGSVTTRNTSIFNRHS